MNNFGKYLLSSFFVLTLVFCEQSTEFSNSKDISRLSFAFKSTLLRYSMRTDYSEESIKEVEDWFSQLDINSQNLFKSKVGAYLGESIIHNYGGSWDKYDGDWGVKLSEGNYVFPFSKVNKFILNGSEDSFYTMYKRISLVLSE